MRKTISALGISLGLALSVHAGAQAKIVDAMGIDKVRCIESYFSVYDNGKIAKQSSVKCDRVLMLRGEHDRATTIFEMGPSISGFLFSGVADMNGVVHVDRVSFPKTPYDEINRSVGESGVIFTHITGQCEVRTFEKFWRSLLCVAVYRDGPINWSISAGIRTNQPVTNLDPDEINRHLDEVPSGGGEYSPSVTNPGSVPPLTFGTTPNVGGGITFRKGIITQGFAPDKPGSPAVPGSPAASSTGPSSPSGDFGGGAHAIGIKP